MASIRVRDGSLVDPLNVRIEDVKPSVCLHSICLLNRFTGHTDYPYSVGQHTLNLYRYVLHYWPEYPEWAKTALVHDWSETWFNDLSSPLKKVMQRYKNFEKKAWAVVAERMQIKDDWMAEFDRFDKAIYINERNALFTYYRDDVQGMGDDRRGLIDPDGILDFSEVNWRWVHTHLQHAFKKEFPDYV